MLIGILGLLLIGVLSVSIVYSAFEWFQALDPSVKAALITALLGLVGLWYAQWHSKTRDIAESHRASKIEIYNVFFDLVEKLQESNIDSSTEDELPDWMKSEFRKLNRGLLLWASPKVITAYLNFRKVSASEGNVLYAVDEMYREIRKDLGNSNYLLKSGDLIRIGLKDPDEFK